MAMRRSELYAPAWSEPLRHLGPKLGFTDRGLGLVCERFDIPVPYRGYWAKRAAGVAPHQTPLPDPLRDDVVEPLQAFDGSGRRLAPEDVPDEWIIPGMLKRTFTPAPKPTVRSPPRNRPTYPALQGVGDTPSQGQHALEALRPTPGPLEPEVAPEMAFRIEDTLACSADSDVADADPLPTTEAAPQSPLLPEVASKSAAPGPQLLADQPSRNHGAYMREQLDRVFTAAAWQQRRDEALGVLAMIALRAAEEPATAARILSWVAEVRGALEADDPIFRLLTSLQTEASRLAA